MANTPDVTPTLTGSSNEEDPNLAGAIAAAETARLAAISVQDERGFAKISPKEEVKPSETQQPTTTSSFKIDNFRTELNNYGVLPSHSFLVRFAPFTGTSALNQALSNYTMLNKDKLILRCDNALLPAVTLIKEEAIRRYGYGPTETVPYNVSFGDFTLQWIVDSNSEIVDFFNKWVNVIVNHDSKGGADMKRSANGYEPYEVGFKDDYSNSKVSVFVYDRQLNTTIQYNIYDVFPIAIQSVNMAWADENQMVKYNVTFAFTDMTIETPRAADNAFFLEAQAEANARKAQQKWQEEEIKVSARDLVNARGVGQTTRDFGSSTALGGNYTVSIPPDVRQNIDNVTAGVPNPSSINVVTIP